jgi:hypothetical protein
MGLARLAAQLCEQMEKWKCARYKNGMSCCVLQIRLCQNNIRYAVVAETLVT